MEETKKTISDGGLMVTVIIMYAAPKILNYCPGLAKSSGTINSNQIHCMGLALKVSIVSFDGTRHTD